MDNSIVDNIDGQLQHLYIRYTELKTEIDVINDDISKLTKARAVLTGENKRAPKVKKATTAKRNNEERTKTVLELVQSEDVEFSAKDIASVTGIPQGSVNSILVQLRDEQKIDFVRVGGPTNTTKFYKAALGYATVT